MAWMNTWERQLEAVQAELPTPERGTERLGTRVVLTIRPEDSDEFDPVAIVEDEVRTLGQLNEADQEIGRQYWHQVRRNWADMGYTGGRFQKLVARAVGNILAEENEENVVYYQTLREWGFYV